MEIFVVTGTNTDVGKTIATAVLVHSYLAAGRGVQVLKPVQTGEPDGRGDARTIEALTGVPARDLYRFPEPLAPTLAAQRAGMAPARLEVIVEEIERLRSQYPNDVLLVEGAGGLLVRLGENFTLIDVAKATGASVLVVTSLGLGSLNLAEMTCEIARHRGVFVAGLIGGSLPAAPDLATRLNIAEMPRLCRAPYLGSVPQGAAGLGGQFGRLRLDLPSGGGDCTERENCVR